MSTPTDIQPDPGTDPPETDPAHSANAEAAKHRHRAKAAEDARDAVKLVADAMAITNDALRNQIIEARVAPHIAPTALPEFMARIDSSTVVNDQGAVDYGKLDAALAADLQAHPHVEAPDRACRPRHRPGGEQ